MTVIHVSIILPKNSHLLFLNSCTNNSGANQDIENKSDNLSFLHINSRSIPKNFDSIQTLLLSLKRFTFSIIGICETWLNENSPEIYSRLQNGKKLKKGRQRRRCSLIHSKIIEIYD